MYIFLVNLDLCGSVGSVFMHLCGSVQIWSMWFYRVLSGSQVSVSYGSDLWGFFCMFLFCVFSSAPWRVPFRASRANRSSFPDYISLLAGVQSRRVAFRTPVPQFFSDCTAETWASGEARKVKNAETRVTPTKAGKSPRASRESWLAEKEQCVTGGWGCSYSRIQS